MTDPTTVERPLTVPVAEESTPELRSDHLQDSLQDPLVDPLQKQATPGAEAPVQASKLGGAGGVKVDISLGKYKRSKIDFLVAVALVEGWTRAEQAACDRLVGITRGTLVGPTESGPGWAPPKPEQWILPLSHARIARDLHTKVRDPKKAKVALEKAVASYNLVHGAWQDYQVALGRLAAAQKTTAEVSVFLATAALSGGASAAIGSAGGGIVAKAGASAAIKLGESAARRASRSYHLNEPFDVTSLLGDGLTAFIASLTGGALKTTLHKHLVAGVDALATRGIPHAAKLKIVAEVLARAGQATVKAAVADARKDIEGKSVTTEDTVKAVAKNLLKGKLKSMLEEAAKAAMAR